MVKRSVQTVLAPSKVGLHDGHERQRVVKLQIVPSVGDVHHLQVFQNALRGVSLLGIDHILPMPGKSRFEMPWVHPVTGPINRCDCGDLQFRDPKLQLQQTQTHTHKTCMANGQKLAQGRWVACHLMRFLAKMNLQDSWHRHLGQGSCCDGTLQPRARRLSTLRACSQIEYSTVQITALRGEVCRVM